MQPSILPIQIIRIGQLVILCVPGGIFQFFNPTMSVKLEVHVVSFLFRDVLRQAMLMPSTV
jgi:hypothetical protein